MISTPSPSRASDTSRHSSALTSDRRSPPMNSNPAITASSRPRRCAVVWDSTPRPSVRGRSAVARIAASPGGVRLDGEPGPEPDGGHGEGGGGGRAARLEDRAEVDGQRGVVNRGGPPPGVQARQRAAVGASGVDAERGVGELPGGRRGDGQRPRRVGASGERGRGGRWGGVKHNGQLCNLRPRGALPHSYWFPPLLKFLQF